MIKIFLFLIALSAFSTNCKACKCGPVSLSRSDKAYDIVIGNVISEKELRVQCDHHSAEVAYSVNVKFSYKENTSGEIIVFGGKGWGECGAIFEEGKSYILVLRECGGKYFTLYCDDNAWLPFADNSIIFLNERYHKNYCPGPAWELMRIYAINSIPAFLAVWISLNAFTHRSEATGACGEKFASYHLTWRKLFKLNVWLLTLIWWLWEFIRFIFP
jgi:hypothetical protein